MAGTILRPQQVDLLAEIEREIADSRRRIIAQAPTGYGKTVVAAALAQKIQSEGKRALFTVPALSLIDQTVERFYAEGVRDVGVIQSQPYPHQLQPADPGRQRADVTAAPRPAGRPGADRRSAPLV